MTIFFPEHSGNPTTDGDFASNSETPLSDEDLSESEDEQNYVSESEHEQSDPVVSPSK